MKLQLLDHTHHNQRSDIITYICIYVYIHLFICLFVCLFVCVEAERHSQHFFSHVGMEPTHPGLNQYCRELMCLAQGHNTVTLVGNEPRTSRFGVRHSTTTPPCSLYTFVNFVYMYIYMQNVRGIVTCTGSPDCRVIHFTRIFR